MTSSNANQPKAGAAQLDPKHVDALRAALRGPVVRPGDADYDDARSVWNGMIDRRPAAIARCLGVADVQACVRFARERDMPLSIKSGGHNIAGLAVCDGGLTIDTSLMRGVFVDPSARIAHAQAGCLLGDVDRETQLHGLAAVLGFVSLTGVAGLTLGGGFGYTSRRLGWTTDNIRSMTLVTADGRIVRASEKENPDLFWGLRGGGGNFGVVVDIEYDLYPLGPEIVGGAVAWHGEAATEVLELYHRLAADAPPELALIAVLRPAPPAPWIDPSAHGKPIVAIFVCHTGKVEDGEKLVAPIKKFGTPVGDICQRRPYVSQQSLLDATQPRGRRYYWKSEYVPDISSDLLKAAMTHAARIPSPHSALVVFPLGEAIGRHPEDHSAVGNRDARAVFNATSSWERPEDDAVNIEWARSAWQDLKQFSTGGTYINFLNAEEAGARIEAAYGKNFRRLAEIKKAWDPDNLFRVNKNIAPA